MLNLEKKPSSFLDFDEQGEQLVSKQIVESYQSGVIDGQKEVERDRQGPRK